MKYGETDPARRRIPVYLVDASGNPVLASPPPEESQLRVSKSGDAWVDAQGTWVNVDAAEGSYYYEATEDEATTPSFLMLRVAHPDAQRFVFAEQIGNRIDPLADDDELRIPVYLTKSDGSGDYIEGLGNPFGEYEVSINGAAFVATIDDNLYEIGLGGYYIQLSSADIVDSSGNGVLRIITDDAMPFVYRFDIFELPEVVVVEEPAPVPIVSTFESDEPQPVDHVEDGINLLPEQFRSYDDGEED